MNYIYSTNTANTDPTAGKLKFDSTTFSAITAFRISTTDNDTVDQTTTLEGWDSPLGSLVLVRTDPENYVLFEISGARTDNSGWISFPITAKASSGTIANGATVEIFKAGLSPSSTTRGRDAGLAYSYSDSTASTDPTAGFLKFDNTVLASITALRISDTDGDGNDLGALLEQLDASDSAARSIVILYKDGSPGNMLVFSVNAARTDNAGWKEFPITFIASSGSFANLNELKLVFALTGDAAGGGGGGGAAGFAFTYIYDGASTAATDPGDGTFRFNNASPASATALYISDVEAVSFRFMTGYFTHQATANLIIVRGDNQSTNSGRAIYRITGAPTHHVDGDGWTEIPIALVCSDGAFFDGILNPGIYAVVEFSGPYA
jgi:hypothetical protein